VEKFRAWSDCDGDVERRFSKDELLAHITLYWVTGTINSANRLSYEARRRLPHDGSGRISVPTGVAIFPKDLVPAPRAFAERFFNVQRGTPCRAAATSPPWRSQSSSSRTSAPSSGACASGSGGEGG